VSCPPDPDAAAILRRAPDVTFRAVPEWRRAYAYTPRVAQLTELNPTAWLIFDLCDGRAAAVIEQDFIAAAESGCTPEAARLIWREGLGSLRASGLVEVHAP
jgi:hypothetical protein